MRKLPYEEIFAKRPTLADLDQSEPFPFFALVENIRSLYNVGSIFRTSDGVRLNTIYLTGYTGYPPRKEIDKTALGAVDSVNWVYEEDPLVIAGQLAKKRIPLIALEHTAESVPYTGFSFPFPFCLIIGNEVEGISQPLLDHAEAAIEIPMHGLKQSLNVAVAYGVVMYHAVSQFLKQNTP